MKRLQFLKTMLGVPVLPAMLGKGPSATRKVYIYYGFVRGFSYGDGYEIYDKLHPETPLTLTREPFNKYDSQAIRIDAFGNKLGYIARESNRALSLMLDAGTSLQAEISHINDEAKDWQAIHIGVFTCKPIDDALPPDACTQVPTPVYDGKYLENSRHGRYLRARQDDDNDDPKIKMWDGYELYPETPLKSATNKAVLALPYTPTPPTTQVLIVTEAALLEAMQAPIDDFEGIENNQTKHDGADLSFAATALALPDKISQEAYQVEEKLEYISNQTTAFVDKITRSVKHFASASNRIAARLVRYAHRS